MALYLLCLLYYIIFFVFVNIDLVTILLRAENNCFFNPYSKTLCLTIFIIILFLIKELDKLEL
jgi:hypothetical protein